MYFHAYFELLNLVELADGTYGISERTTVNTSSDQKPVVLSFMGAISWPFFSSNTSYFSLYNYGLGHPTLYVNLSDSSGLGWRGDILTLSNEPINFS